MTQQFQQDRELGWDDTIQQDSADNILLEPGDYIYEVVKMERSRYNPGPNSKLPACNMAKVEIKISTDLGEAVVFNNLYLHTSTEGLLSSFFASIGQKRKGEPARMNWNQVVGSKGAVKIKNREYNGSKYNDVQQFYPSDASYYENKEMPAIVQQLQQSPNQAYQQPQTAQNTYYQQPQTNNQGQQQGGFTAGQF